MAIILDDITLKSSFYPFTNTRSLGDLRMGIFTFCERWSVKTGDSIYVISEVKDDHSYQYHERLPANVLVDEFSEMGEEKIEVLSPWDMIKNNSTAIKIDFKLVSKNKTSEKLSITNNLINEPNIFVEKGVKAEFVTLNASGGPIYIGKNAEIMEGSIIRGPVAICEGAIVKMGSKIYGGTTIGPYCVASGEIKNAILSGYSNKSHEGYLGDSLIGYWCNLGAGTSNSNVKNTAGNIKVWNHQTSSFVDNGTKCGMLMGDYSRSAINTSFNTGTVVGTCCNIFGSGFPEKFIGDFSWGTEKYKLDKALTDIEKWKALKGRNLTNKEKKALTELYDN